MSHFTYLYFHVLYFQVENYFQPSKVKVDLAQHERPRHSDIGVNFVFVFNFQKMSVFQQQFLYNLTNIDAVGSPQSFMEPP